MAPELLQGMAPESTPRESAASAGATDKNEKEFCQERLKTLFPEVKQARAVEKAVVEAKSTTKEAVDRKREKLKLEMRQTWNRYD